MTQITDHDARLRSTTLDTPVGPLTIVASERGIREIRWPDDVRPPVDPYTSDDSDPHSGHAVLHDAVCQLQEYFAGERTDFDVALDAVGTDFQREAWRALGKIGYGAVATYGEQAERMGDRGKARAVGAANGRNPIPIIVPCHRVVGADGSLTGFAGGLEVKEFLLAHERRVAGQTLL